MKKYILPILTILFIVFTLIIALPTSNNKNEISSDLWKEDILYLDKKLKTIHPDLYRNISEKEWDKEINNLLNNVEKSSDTEILLSISQLISKLNDGHTLLEIEEALTSTSDSRGVNDIVQFPIIINEFSDGYRVVASDDNYKDIRGAKLISINNIKIEDILDKVMNIMSGDNKQGKKGSAIICANSLDILKFLDIVDKEIATFEFEINDNEKVTLEIKAKKYSDIVGGMIERKNNIIEDEINENNPLYWFKTFEDDKILYFQYNRCISDDTSFINKEERNDLPNFYDLEKSLVNEINNSEFDKFIIDLRNNRGGSLGLTQSLIINLQNKTDIENKDIYVFTGKNTFSAGAISAYQFRDNLDVTIVGEETAGNVNLFTTWPEDDIITLPNSKKQIRHASSFVNYNNEIDGGVEPDVYMIQSFESYLNGIDDLYEYVNSQ